MMIAIMQPYLFPYLGYFQLINAVDRFVIYDNIQYTKKGWINRNRILLNGKDAMFTIPLKSDSDFLNVNDRFLADTSPKEIAKVLGILKSSYVKAPNIKQVYPLLESIFLFPEKQLFQYVLNSIREINHYLDITTDLVISSEIPIDHSLKSKDKVKAICHALNADHYLNPIGGVELYDRDEFLSEGITLRFHKMNSLVYPQNSLEFVPSLSIIDVLMYNSRDQVKDWLGAFSLQ